MMDSEIDQKTDPREGLGDLSGLCRIGGYAAFALIVYCLATLAQIAIVGVGAPPTAAGVFDMVHGHRIEGLLRLDLVTIVAMPLYYLLFLGLFAALKAVDHANTLLATCMAFVGTTLVLATPTALPMLPLSARYAAATSDAVRNQLLAAGEAVMATDMWHGSGAILGGVLLQCGAVLICVVMLRSSAFGKATAWLGIVMFGVDLGHIVLGPFVPYSGMILMAIAGPLYPIWFFLVGRRLLQLAGKERAVPLRN
jgi:hypothetical protein